MFPNRRGTWTLTALPLSFEFRPGTGRIPIRGLFDRWRRSTVAAQMGEEGFRNPNLQQLWYCDERKKSAHTRAGRMTQTCRHTDIPRQKQDDCRLRPLPSPVLFPGSRRRSQDTSATETDGSGGSRDGDDTVLSTDWLNRLSTNHTIQSTARQTTTGRQPTPTLMTQVPPAPPPCQASLSHLSHSRFTFLVEPTPTLIHKPRSSLSLVLPALARTSCIQHCSLATLAHPSHRRTSPSPSSVGSPAKPFRALRQRRVLA
ncbi:hypothetical protein CDEST_13965 [Colletotrichum destructivum]|uniref:Uncharacterized protein n=1 Tax=Colletotrichum destructivum TaxID=34406 RepID=A0AAX4J0H5_9PEZI|nr:hypothetical protein CDEST_13965 [Colletotrichum destructivum]